MHVDLIVLIYIF